MRATPLFGLLGIILGFTFKNHIPQTLLLKSGIWLSPSPSCSHLLQVSNTSKLDGQLNWDLTRAVWPLTSDCLPSTLPPGGPPKCPSDQATLLSLQSKSPGGQAHSAQLFSLWAHLPNSLSLSHHSGLPQAPAPALAHTLPKMLFPQISLWHSLTFLRSVLKHCLNRTDFPDYLCKIALPSSTHHFLSSFLALFSSLTISTI